MSDVCTCCGYDHGCQDSIRIAELEAQLYEPAMREAGIDLANYKDRIAELENILKQWMGYWEWQGQHGVECADPNLLDATHAELEAELKEAQTVATTALQRELELKAENKQLRSALEDIAWNMAVGEGGDSYEMRAEAKAALAEKNNEL